jgi:predicted metal-dependent hydrolase
MENLTIRDINIEVEHKDIKHVHLAVYPPDGRVHISVPVTMTMYSVRLYAVTKLSWIESSIREVLNQQRQSPREYVSGEDHYLFGHRHILQVRYAQAAPTVTIINKKIIQLTVRPDSSIEKKAKVMNEWYRELLKKRINTYINSWQKKMDVVCSGWEVKQMKTKWGSCNHHTRHIIFNLELAKKPNHCIEYVVVHELAHILVRTHNMEYKSILNKYMPQWENYQKELNEFII